MLLSVLATMAIVTQDQAALRAGPRESAAQQAVLWQGDALEVRGQRLDYLQVWDHRRERAGYVRASQVRTTALKPAEADGLLSVLRFLRDTPGAEALGLGYAAAYLQAVPAERLDAEPFDAIGVLADRLARRAALKPGQTSSTAVSAHLEVANHYGVRIAGTERDGALQPCYDGEAFRRVLALPSSPEQRARAALGLTRHDCVDSALSPVQRLPLDQWRAQVLDQVNAAAFAQLPEPMKNKLRLRRAGVWASLAFQHARRDDAAPAAAAAQRALAELAGVDKTELSDEDQRDYADAAIRVGASRWAAEPAPVAAASGLAVRAEPGQPGETCVALIDARTPAKPLARRCSYGLVWTASARANASASALALAVQPLDGWRELWVFRRQKNEWLVDVLPPAAQGPELGYVEFAGWVPGGERLLLARESRIEGRFKRSFEVMRLESLQPEKSASTPELLVLFGRWQDAAWKRQTVSLR
ncbi:hypothetical protein HLB44_19180 [Aquincola sp. S2]|uniref:SH3 domain-containing protein n=1 Tax=Pseudaquabacterium terrae TaxID=2732868 RepID=A0ABX2EKF4_9BURK|nr:hypothetical protein [Aquabacterium terrae]NRF69122.1 hypothetical protein [Aquabacterium terrae]